MTKYFKGDATELKMFDSGNGILTVLGLALDEFFEDAYGSIPMGELLYDEERVPLTNAIRREIFIRSFKEIFEAWSFAGTFESYILVFKKIFGEDVEIDFTVPAPGKLEIDITTAGVQEYEILVREIVSNAYVYYSLVDDVGDFITLATVLGLETPGELEKVLFTMVPNGIFTAVTLTIG